MPIDPNLMALEQLVAFRPLAHLFLACLTKVINP